MGFRPLAMEVLPLPMGRSKPRHWVDMKNLVLPEITSSRLLGQSLVVTGGRMARHGMARRGMARQGINALVVPWKGGRWARAFMESGHMHRVRRDKARLLLVPALQRTSVEILLWNSKLPRGKGNVSVSNAFNQTAVCLILSRFVSCHESSGIFSKLYGIPVAVLPRRPWRRRRWHPESRCSTSLRETRRTC